MAGKSAVSMDFSTDEYSDSVLVVLLVVHWGFLQAAQMVEHLGRGLDSLMAPLSVE